MIDKDDQRLVMQGCLVALVVVLGSLILGGGLGLGVRLFLFASGLGG